MSVEVHVLDKENELGCILLGLKFLVPHISEFFLDNCLIKVKINKCNHVIPLIEENQKLTFRAKEAFEAGAGLLQCYPSSIVFESSVYQVPLQFCQLLGTNIIGLTPRSIKKSTRQSTFNQTFVFEIHSGMSFNKHSEVFELFGPIKNKENLVHNCSMQTFPSELD